MRIAVVGGKGTLGRYVCAELARRGHDVRVLSRSGEYRVDLTTGQGLGAALEGCAAVVDASNAMRGASQVLVEGSKRLLTAGAAAGVAHHVCVSIVGCDRVPMGYYRIKTAQEHVVEHGTVPWTIVRATQFHELAAAAFGAVAKYRVLPAPRIRLQTVAAAEVAEAVADVTEGPARRGRFQVAGPQVCTAAELARAWQRVTGRSAVLLPLPLPGRTGRELRRGALTASHPDVRGRILFEDWLAARKQD